MPYYIGCMSGCCLFQCFCYLMAFLVISFANNFENMIVVNLFSFTRKKHPNNSSELRMLACRSDHNLQSGGPSSVFLLMASLLPSPPHSAPPPPQKKRTPGRRLLKSSHPCCVSLYWELTLSFLCSMKALQKIALFCEPTLQTNNKLFMFLFFLRLPTHRPLSRIFLVVFFAPQFIRLV